jgi:hypothetical protein
MSERPSVGRAPLTGNQRGRLARDEWLRRQGLHLPPMLLRYAVRLRGRLDVPALQSALASVVQRHEALRTGLLESAGGVMQEVYAGADVPLQRTDLSGSADASADLSGFLAEVTGRPLALDRPPLMRVGLATLSASEHVLALAIEHLMVDGWSLGVVLNELAEFYGAALGQGDAPDAPAPSWLDWTLAERAWVDAGGLQEEAEIWRTALADDNVALPPSCSRLPRHRRYVADRAAAQVDAPTSTAFAAILDEAAVSPAAGLLTCFGAALVRADGRASRARVATPVLNRSLETEGRLVGWLANQRPVGVTVEPGNAFDDVVPDVQVGALDALEHGRAAIDELVLHVAPDRWARFPPVVVAFTPPYVVSPPAFAGLEAALQRIDVPRWMMGVSLDCVHGPDDSLHLELLWDAGRFGAPTMTGVLEDVRSYVTAVTGDASAPLRQ